MCRAWRWSNPMSGKEKDELRSLPAVELLLQHPVVRDAQSEYPRSIVVQAAREVLAGIRRRVLAAGSSKHGDLVGSHDAIAAAVVERARRKSEPSYRWVVNATGVVVHTNLGRSALSERAAAAVSGAATRYGNLEYDLATGARTTRQMHVETLLCEITGAEAAFVVNNNAGAVMLIAYTLARGREVICSRGELIEIGGSFRLPEVLTASGARLVEVGTTNRTSVHDYGAAIGPDTAMLLKVHLSNFVMSGFVSQVPLRDLVELGARHGVPVVEDLGSGALIDTSELGLGHEPTPQESVEAGADVVTFSGDKLLGGTQAGILVGRRDVIDKARRSPVARAVRIDKMNLAGMEATLVAYRDPRGAVGEIPTLRLIARSAEELEKSARDMARALEDMADRAGVSVEPGWSEVGGGASPDVALPTVLVCLAPRARTAEDLAAGLRAGEPAVVARIKDDRVLIDPRTLLAGEDRVVVESIRRVLGRGSAGTESGKDGVR